MWQATRVIIKNSFNIKTASEQKNGNIISERENLTGLDKLANQLTLLTVNKSQTMDFSLYHSGLINVRNSTESF